MIVPGILSAGVHLKICHVDRAFQYQLHEKAQLCDIKINKYLDTHIFAAIQRTPPTPNTNRLYLSKI